MKKQLIGVVTSDKCSKTRRVEVRRLYKHPKYGKIVRGRTVCHVHDERDTSKMGDTVEIAECRPLSRTKRWSLVRVITAGDQLAATPVREEAADPENAGALE